VETVPASVDVKTVLGEVRDNLTSVIRGKDDRVDLLLAALLARGHVLIEDLPGLGKTTLAKCLATSIRAEFRRVQFTPDLLPTDILGGSIYDQREASFTFHPGPIFTNVLLADEINRASPRTQSSLLEAMAERQVTIEGVRRELPPLFMVVATENPIEFHGTYPLPEAQLDRFLIRMTLGYADAETETAILFAQQQGHPLDRLSAVADAATVVALQQAVQEVHVAQEIGRYVVDLMRQTRQHPQVQVGASPRGALGLFRLAQAFALMAGRDHVVPDDVQSGAVAVLAHRLVLDTKARYSGGSKEAVVEEVLKNVKVPT
jgi:MoxR-like ATPase